MRFVTKYLREFVAFCFRLTFVPFFLREIVGNKLPIIVNYHNPDPITFRSHLTWYASRFKFISLDDLINSLNTNTLSKLPSNSLVITFDDGHRNNYKLLELFKEFNVKPTIYVCSGIVDTHRQFWFKSVINPQNYKFFKNDVRLLKLKTNNGFKPERDYPLLEMQALTKQELLDLSEIADIGCHTRFHPVLTMVDDEKIEDEIIGAKIEIEKLLGIAINHFSYPNGDYGKREINLVKKAGFLSARTINSGLVKSSTNPFELPNIGVTDNASINILSLQITRLPFLVKNFFKTGNFSGKYHSINANL